MTASTFLPTAILTGVASGLGFDDVAVREGVCPRLVREVWKRMERDGRQSAALRLRHAALRASLSHARDCPSPLLPAVAGFTAPAGLRAGRGLLRRGG